MGYNDIVLPHENADGSISGSLGMMSVLVKNIIECLLKERHGRGNAWSDTRIQGLAENVSLFFSEQLIEVLPYLQSTIADLSTIDTLLENAYEGIVKCQETAGWSDGEKEKLLNVKKSVVTVHLGDVQKKIAKDLMGAYSDGHILLA